MRLIKTACFVSCLLMAACCKKVDCGHIYYPEINITFEGAPDTATFYATVSRFENGTSTLADVNSYEAGKKFTFNPGKHYPQDEISGYFYVVTSPYNTSDTLYDLRYEKKMEEVECGSCFLGPSRSTSLRYSDFSYRYKGTAYPTGSAVVFRK